MIKKFFVFLISFFLISCGESWKNFESAISGKKKRTTDEYLIKKKDPLILPPEYDQLPLPGSKKTEKQNSNRIEVILGDNQSSNKNKKEKSKLEKIIEQEIRKSN